MGQMPNQLIRRTKAKQRPSKRGTARHDAEKRLAQLERELRSNEERLRALIDNPVMGITVLDRDHRFLMTNSTYQAMTGYTDDELKEITPLDITPVDQREVNRKFFREVQRGDRRHYQLIKQLVRKDGKLIWIQLYVFAIRNRAPVGPHLCAMIFDITEKMRAEEEVARRTSELIKANEELSKEIVERKRSEEQLRRSEAYLAQAQRLSRTGSFGWTRSSGEIHWSDESFRIFALDPKVKPTIDVVVERVHPDDREVVRRAISETSQGEKDFDVMHRIVTPDGSVKHVHVLSSTMMDMAGNQEIVGAITDVTERVRAQAELQQIRDELARVARVTTLGELTAAIAHEVNQPLTAVISSGNACLRRLSHETPNVEAARKSVERVISEGNRAAEVIKRLRALVQKAPAQRERLSINEAITEVLPIIDVEIRRNSISLRTDLASDVPPILGDRIQLQQVMLNLMLNAIDAMSGTAPPRDLLVTSARGELNEVLVTVRDTGTGLDEKSLDRLFEAFYTTKAQGMGIGLAVSRTIVQTHGGSLWARTNEPRGAVFAFTLPVNVEQAPLPPKADMSTTVSQP
jgi:PAS domain S-box-containing protein